MESLKKALSETMTSKGDVERLEKDKVVLGELLQLQSWRAFKNRNLELSRTELSIEKREVWSDCKDERP